MGPPREFRLEVFQNRPGILPAPSLRPARASLPFCESYFSRGDFLGPPILAPPPRPPPGPPRKWNFFEKGGPLFSWLHRKIKSRQKSGSFWPAGSKAARNLAAFGRPAQQPPEIWQLLAGRLKSRQKSGSFWPAGSTAARNLAAFEKAAGKLPAFWQLLRKLPES